MLVSDSASAENSAVFHRGIQDLVKKQWVRLIDELKRSGGLPVAELKRRLGGSYMGLRDQCDALVKLGYLETWRVPRTKVGRPEIMYRLSDKAGQLFPEAGSGLSLGLLESARHLFGGAAPERMLFQYFQQQGERWRLKLARAETMLEKATLLCALREKEGCFGSCEYDAERNFRIEEYHHPLTPIFAEYPNAVQFELRVMEELLGSKVQRQEISEGKGGVVRVDYVVLTLGQHRD